MTKMVPPSASLVALLVREPRAVGMGAQPPPQLVQVLVLGNNQEFEIRFHAGKQPTGGQRVMII